MLPGHGRERRHRPPRLRRVLAPRPLGPARDLRPGDRVHARHRAGGGPRRALSRPRGAAHLPRRRRPRLAGAALRARRVHRGRRRRGLLGPVAADPASLASVSRGRRAESGSGGWLVCCAASPSRWAIAAASPRLAALSLLRMWETWTPAVRALI